MRKGGGSICKNRSSVKNMNFLITYKGIIFEINDYSIKIIDEDKTRYKYIGDLLKYNILTIKKYDYYNIKINDYYYIRMKFLDKIKEIVNLYEQQKDHIYNYIFKKIVFNISKQVFLFSSSINETPICIDYSLIINLLNNKLILKDDEKYYFPFTTLLAKDMYDNIFSLVDYSSIIYYFDNFNMCNSRKLLENHQLPFYIINKYLKNINWNINIFLRQNLSFNFVLSNIEFFKRFFNKENSELLKQIYTEEELNQLSLLTLL